MEPVGFMCVCMKICYKELVHMILENELARLKIQEKSVFQCESKGRKKLCPYLKAVREEFSPTWEGGSAILFYLRFNW